MGSPAIRTRKSYLPASQLPAHDQRRTHHRSATEEAAQDDEGAGARQRLPGTTTTCPHCVSRT